MKRRQFFRRLAAASTAFVVAPGVFKALPATRNVRNEIMSARVAHLTSQPLDFHEWLASQPPPDFPMPVDGLYDFLMRPNSIATQS